MSETQNETETDDAVDKMVTHVEIQWMLVSHFGPALEFDPSMIDIEKRTIQSIRALRQAQMKGDTRAAIVVAEPDFGDEHREYVLEKFEGVDAPVAEEADADIREILEDFFEAGLMHEWSDRLREKGAWRERPLAALCGYVLCAPIRAALEDAELPYLPRAASNVILVSNSKAAIRARKAVREAIEDAPVSISPDRSSNKSVTDMLGPMAVDGDGDEIVEPGDGSFDAPDSLKRL